jgi:hypothetical protein
MIKKKGGERKACKKHYVTGKNYAAEEENKTLLIRQPDPCSSIGEICKINDYLTNGKAVKE